MIEEDLKRCSKCENKQLKLNFPSVITKKDSLRNQCKKCTNQYHSDNKEKRKLPDRSRRQ